MRHSRNNDLSACPAGAGCLFTGNPDYPASTSGQHANNTTQRWEAEAVSYLQDNQLSGTVD